MCMHTRNAPEITLQEAGDGTNGGVDGKNHFEKVKL